MRPRHYLLAAILAGSMTAPVLGEDGPPRADLGKETREFIGALQTYTAEQRDRALEKSRAALERLDARLEELEADLASRWDRMDAAARAESRESLRNLRRQRIELAEWFGGLRSGSAKAWDDVKEGFADAYRSLQERLREAAARAEE